MGTLVQMAKAFNKHYGDEGEDILCCIYSSPKEREHFEQIWEKSQKWKKQKSKNWRFFLQNVHNMTRFDHRFTSQAWALIARREHWQLDQWPAEDEDDWVQREFRTRDGCVRIGDVEGTSELRISNSGYKSIDGKTFIAIFRHRRIGGGLPFNRYQADYQTSIEGTFQFYSDDVTPIESVRDRLDIFGNSCRSDIFGGSWDVWTYNGNAIFLANDRKAMFPGWGVRLPIDPEWLSRWEKEDEHEQE